MGPVESNAEDCRKKNDIHNFKTQANRLRKLAIRQTQLKHHEKNLEEFIKNGLTPTGLQISTKCSVVPISNQKKWTNIHQEFSKQLTRQSLKECRIALNNISIQVTQLQKDLKKLCNEETWTTCLNHINRTTATRNKILEKSRNKKLHNKLTKTKQDANNESNRQKGSKQNNKEHHDLPEQQTTTKRRRRFDRRRKRKPKPLNNITTTVYNLSNVYLTDNQMHLLEKGLGFSVTPDRIDQFQLAADIDNTVRNFRLREFFSRDNTHQEDEEHTTIKTTLPRSLQVRSRWTPEPGRSRDLDQYVNIVKREVIENITKKRAHSNLTVDERTALNELCQRASRDIVIVRADKGGGTCVLSREDYVAEGMRQLNDINTYKSLEKDITTKIVHEVTTICSGMRSAKIIDDKLYRGLIPKEAKPGRLRLQPKVHKQGHPGRPIISGNGMATEKLSAYVDYILSPIMNTDFIPSYVKDTPDFLNRIKDIGHIPTGAILVTMDVVSLYTNIPHLDGLNAMEVMLNRTNIESSAIPWIRKAAQCVLTNNNLTFDGKHYLQLEGTAMGSRMAPKYACAFMAILEENLFKKSNNKPFFYVRFIDDGFMIWLAGMENLNKLIKLANEHHPSIRFTFEISTEKLPFLDTTVHLTNNSIQTELYSKPTDAHQYLLPKSCHPKHVTKNIPNGLALRIRRICSTEEYFEKHAKILATHLKNRNYPESAVNKAIDIARNKNRNEILKPQRKKEQPNRQPPFITTYNPLLPRIKNTFTKYQYILHRDERLRNLFPEPPIIAYRKCPTLQNILVRAELKPLEVNKRPNGFTHCRRKGCTTCQYSQQSTTFTSSRTNRTFTHKSAINCNTTNVIYLITCNKCGLQYIGETGRKLKRRISEHILSIKKKTDTAVAQHFNNPGHTLSNFTVTAIEKLNHGEGYRRNKENFWIRMIDTFEPTGMNIKDKS